jgi:N-hydroxyarylamine O-acetyltransferase
VDVDAYLDRIDYRGPRAATLETLGGLTRAHLLAVPFENLDIHAGRPILLDPGRLYDKIVGRRRGGFCYELNSVFAGLLDALGFRVTLLSAGVARDAGGFGPEFDHLALRVELEDAWLADVGFGESFDPVPFDERAAGEYRIATEGAGLVLYRRELPCYRFTLTPRVLGDFDGMCRHHQTSPESSFTQRRLISKATADGRVTLTSSRLIVTRGEQREEREVGSQTEFDTLCRQYFGIVNLATQPADKIS